MKREGTLCAGASIPILSSGRSRYGDLTKDVLKEMLRGFRPKSIFFLENQSVGKDGDHQELDIVGQHILSLPKGGECLTGTH